MQSKNSIHGKSSDFTKDFILEKISKNFQGLEKGWHLTNQIYS